MKNRTSVVVVFIAALVVAVPAGAQQKWQFGLKGGVNLAQLSGEQAGIWLSGADFNVSGTLLDGETGFIGGGYGRVQLGKSFAVQLDMLYSSKGGTGMINGTANLTGSNNIVYNAQITGSMELNLDYLEFPLLAVLTLPAADGVSFAPYAGFSAGVLIQANAYLVGTSSTPLGDGTTQLVDFSEAYNVASAVSDYDGQFVLGATVEWETRHGSFFVDTRYSLSMGTIDASGDKTIRNSVVSLMIGFGWGKGTEIE